MEQVELYENEVHCLECDGTGIMYIDIFPFRWECNCCEGEGKFSEEIS